MMPAIASRVSCPLETVSALNSAHGAFSAAVAASACPASVSV